MKALKWIIEPTNNYSMDTKMTIKFYYRVPMEGRLYRKSYGMQKGVVNGKHQLGGP